MYANIKIFVLYALGKFSIFVPSNFYSLYSLYSLIIRLNWGERFIHIDATYNDLINLHQKVQFVEQSRASSASNNGHIARGSYLHYLK